MFSFASKFFYDNSFTPFFFDVDNEDAYFIEMESLLGGKTSRGKCNDCI